MLPKVNPLLNRLKKQDESEADFAKINDAGHYLLRWLNYHLVNAGYTKEIKNFGVDLKVYTYNDIYIYIYQ